MPHYTTSPQASKEAKPRQRRKCFQFPVAFAWRVVAGRYFAFAKLNVNWSAPCVLYEYAPQAQSLTELARWDKVDLTGLALP